MPPTANLPSVKRSSANAITRAYEATVEDISPQERMIVSKINTGALDRYKTVIDPMGIDLKAYRSNPCVLWEHGRDPQRGSLPIGKNVGIQAVRQMNGSIVARTQFAKDDYSQQLYEFYRDGTLNGWSVNFLPDHLRCGPPTKEEIRARPELDQQWEDPKTGEWRSVIMFRGGELAEYSGVSVPGNPETLTVTDRHSKLLDLIARGLLSVPDEVRDLLDRTMTDSMGGLAGGGGTVAPAESPTQAKRYITHDDGKWIVHAESGKVLGTHDNEEDAKKQLAAIEANKHADRATPYLDADAGVYVVRSMDGKPILSTADAGLARDALEAMTGRKRTFEDLHFELINSIRTNQEQMRQAREEFKSDVVEILNLMVYGRT